MKNFLFLNIINNKKNKSNKTELIFIKKIYINKIRSIISFNNFIFQKKILMI